MTNYKIIIQYDGSKYYGWQSQKSTDNTIQAKLSQTISRIVNYPVDVIGSGRTDAGVHAIGQVANFHLKSPLADTDDFLNELNIHLPEDIAVVSICKVSERFHSRYDAVSKTYRYVIHTSTVSDVFNRKYQYQYKGSALNYDLMKQGAKILLGEHDFMSFCNNKHIKKSTIRTINSIDIDVCNDKVAIDYNGNGFLQGMVRVITGTLIEVGNGTKSVGDIEKILSSRDRQNAGYTVPACGLTLIEVNYQ